MKRVLVLSSVMLLLLGGLGVVSANADLGTNITILDKTPPPGQGTGLEDNEVTQGAVTGQRWDLEGFYFNSANRMLSMVGGWNFQNGLTYNGHTYFSGDILLDTNSNAKFGAPGSTSNLNSFYQYDYAIHVNWTGGTWDAYKLTDNTQFILTSLGPTAQIDSNPLSLANINHGETLVASGSLTQVTLTQAEAQALGLLDWGPNGVSDPLDPNVHYAVTGFDLGFLGNSAFMSSFTYSCGNDNQHGAVPIPGSVLLMGSGLVGLATFEWRRRRRS